MIPNNKEHREAYQEEINRKREEFLKDKPDEKTKHEVVKKCNEMLSKAGIPYMAFFYMDGYKESKSGVWQFNNVDHFILDRDKLTDKDREFLYDFYSGLSVGFLSDVLGSQKLDDEAIRKFLFFLGVVEGYEDDD